MQDITDHFIDRWNKENPSQPAGVLSDLSEYKPAKGQSFHLILCNWSLEYLRYDKAVKTFERLSKHLVDGGLFIIKGNWKPAKLFKGNDEMRSSETQQMVRRPWLYR